MRLLSIVVVTALAFPSRSAVGQALAYDHRSTVLGDYFSGRADATTAEATYILREAQAEYIFVQAQMLDQNRRYELANQQILLALGKLKVQEETARLRDQRRRAAEEAKSRETTKPKADTAPAAEKIVWPRPLRDHGYECSRSMIENLLASLTDGEADFNFEAIMRKALATEIGVLRAKLALRHTVSAPEYNASLAFLSALEDSTAPENVAWLSERALPYDNLRSVKLQRHK